MTLRVAVNPEFFKWARERADKDPNKLRKKFKNLTEWERGKIQPTFKQLENFAKATYAPFGYFFMDRPPKEKIPIPDLRTIGNVEITRPSPDLLDTIYLCQQRQDWYREFICSMGAKALDFVGTVNIRESIEKTAEKMRTTLGFSLDKRRKASTWTEALRLFVEKIDEVGIMVMISGVVGSNTQRKLDTNEFRGFALSDDFAPLIFINGADSKSAQMFTLAHELAHIWPGKSALSNTDLTSHPSNSVEVWCNKVAAEFLVPLENIKRDNIGNKPLEAVPDLVRNYKVSSLVIIRRLLDAQYIKRDEFDKAFKKELQRIKNLSKGKGGDFYRTIGVRDGKRFMRDLIASTLEGHTSLTEALRLLGIKKMDTFQNIGKELGIILE